MESHFAALGIKSFAKKSVEKTDFAARPADGYANFNMGAGLRSCGAPADGVTAVMLGDGEVEVKQVRLAWLHIEGEPNHAIREVEIEESLDVAINVDKRIKNQSVHFIFHNTLFYVPSEGALQVPVKAGVPIGVLASEILVPILLVFGKTRPGY